MSDATAMDVTPINQTVVDRLNHWCQSSSWHLLLDLRSPNAYRTHRVQPSTNIPWYELEQNWFALPAQCIPFAILLPTELDGRKAQMDERCATPSSSLPLVKAAKYPNQEAIESETSSNHLSDKSSSTAVPIGPSSPQFEFSHANVLQLLRFYHWIIPDEWIFVDTDELWKAAEQVPVLKVCQASDPIERRVLFAPSPYVQKYFEFIQHELQQTRQANSSSIAASMTTTSSSTAPLSTSTPFECFDVACGSGRDMCWMLWTNASLTAATPTSDVTSPTAAWHMTGVDVSSSLLERAHHLAGQLDVGAYLETYQTRINQSTGEWKMFDKASATATPNAPSSIGSNTAFPRFDQAPLNDSSSLASSLQVTTASSDLFLTSRSSTSDDSAASAATSDTVIPSPLVFSRKDGRREKRRQKDALRAIEAATKKNLSVSQAPFLIKQYDLIIMIRFLSRVFIRQQLNKLLKPGGLFLLSTFIDDGITQYEHPANREMRIGGTNEILQLAKDAGLEVISNEYGRCEDGRPVSDCLLRKPMVPLDRESFIAQGWSQLNVDFVESITAFLPALEIIYLHRTCHAWLRIADRIRTPHIPFPQRRFNHRDRLQIIPQVFHSLIRRHIASLGISQPLTAPELEQIARHLPKLQKLLCSIAFTEGSSWVFPSQLKKLKLTFNFESYLTAGSSGSAAQTAAPSNWLNDCLVGVSELTSLNNLQLKLSPISDDTHPDRLLSPMNLHPLVRLVDSLTHLSLFVPLTTDHIRILRQLINLIVLQLSIYDGFVTRALLSELLAEPLPFRLERFEPYGYPYSNEDVPLLKRLTHLTRFDSDDCMPDLTDLSFLSHMVQLRNIYIQLDHPQNLAESLYGTGYEHLTALQLGETDDIHDQDLRRIFSRSMPVLKRLDFVTLPNMRSLAFLAPLSATLEGLSIINCRSIESSELVHLRFFPHLHHLDLTFSFAHPLDSSTLAHLQPTSSLFEHSWLPALRTFKYEPFTPNATYITQID